MLHTVRDLITSVLLGVALFMVIDNVTARSHIQGPSMEPTLQTGQMLLVSRVGISGVTERVYAATQQDEVVPVADASENWLPARGSICTFVKPGDPSQILVKRLVGLPGETVAIDHGVVHINGVPLDEPYVVNHDRRSMPPTRVPLDSVFMLGDNRPQSADSRSFGPIPRGNLLGVAVLRYWPPDQAALFVGQ